MDFYFDNCENRDQNKNCINTFFEIDFYYQKFNMLKRRQNASIFELKSFLFSKD